MRVYRNFIVALGFNAFLALGCGGPSVVPVSGVVTLNGKALTNATVLFQPKATDDDNINPGPGSAAQTDAEGKYTLRVVTTGQDGAHVGKHRVEISAFGKTRETDSGGDQRQAPQRNLVPARYNDKTTLEFDVPSGGTREANFALQSP